MVYAIRRTGPAGPEWLKAACFGEVWDVGDSPAQAMKLSTEADAELFAADLLRPAGYSAPVVVAVAPGHEYPDPGPASAPAVPPAPDVPPVDLIRAFVLLNGKAC